MAFCPNLSAHVTSRSHAGVRGTLEVEIDHHLYQAFNQALLESPPCHAYSRQGQEELHRPFRKPNTAIGGSPWSCVSCAWPTPPEAYSRLPSHGCDFTNTNAPISHPPNPTSQTIPVVECASILRVISPSSPLFLWLYGYLQWTATSQLNAHVLWLKYHNQHMQTPVD